MTETPTTSTAAGGKDGRLAGRVALITGASRGIGRAVARAFAREGAELLLLARTTGALEEVDDEVRAAGGTATLVPSDMADFDALDRLGEAIHGRWGRLDILIGNAGTVGPISPVGHITPKDWQGLLDVNLTANWRLIRSMAPLLRLSEAGRAIFTTAAEARSHPAYWGGYAMSKAALEAIVLAYAAECANTPVRVNLIDPGRIHTKLREKAEPGIDHEALPQADTVAPLFVDLAASTWTRNGEVVTANGRPAAGATSRLGATP